ncbi:hypothetical protein CCUS01_08982, partial [Colletotrichum cuscutae]
LIHKVIPFKKRPFSSLIKEYSNKYSILVKLSIPYYYKIFVKIANLVTFNK